MASEDARPFASLKQCAAEFQDSFQKDIENCIVMLDNKITDLIRNPDSSENTSNIKKTVDSHLEFSKAKFTIFLNMKAYFDEVEEKWLNEIAEMKKEFLENVEIFLAGTKLEVKLPSKYALAPKPRFSLSPKNKQDSALHFVASSIYPLISSIATKVPFSRPSHIKDDDEFVENEESESDSDSIVFEQVKEPAKKVTRGNKNTALKLQSEIFENSRLMDVIKSVRRGAAVIPNESSILSQSHIEEDDELVESESDSNSMVFEQVKEPVKKVTRGKKNTTLKLQSEIFGNSPVKNVVKSTRRGAAVIPNESSIMPKTPAKEIIPDKKKIVKSQSLEPKNTRRKTMAFSDSTVDADLFPSSSKVVRRRTMFVPQSIDEDLPDPESIPVEDVKEIKNKSKRKTMCFSELSVVPSPKRLKTSGRKNMHDFKNALEDDAKNNLLECDESSESEAYTSWMALSSIDSKVPTTAGIYELKIWRAKKPAFIGSCENLRVMLTLHRLKQNSGNKHLDKFLERNSNDVHVRYETISSNQLAKEELKNRIKNFAELYKTTPAYN